MSLKGALTSLGMVGSIALLKEIQSAIDPSDKMSQEWITKLIEEWTQKPVDKPTIWYSKTEFIFLGVGIIIVMFILMCSWKNACGKKEVQDSVELEVSMSDPPSESEQEEDIQENAKNIE